MCLSVPQIPQRETLRRHVSLVTRGRGKPWSRRRPGLSITAAAILSDNHTHPFRRLHSAGDIYPSFVPGRVCDSVHDETVTVPVVESRTVWTDRFVFSDRDEVMVHLVDKGVFPTDPSSLIGPVLLYERVILG